MKPIRTGDPAFEKLFDHIRKRGRTFDEGLMRTVQSIVQDVAARGDEALFDYTERFDGCRLDSRSAVVSGDEWDEAAALVAAEDAEALRLAADRIERFHRIQVAESWFTREKDGVGWGQRILPLPRVGVYAPGGLAVYPSTVLMAAIPARLAGVEEIYLASPTKGRGVHPLIAAAARIAGVTKIFKVGGAQAIAALAFGTRTVPAVDKIVGPGNVYVAAAKRLVYGIVAVDMIAGPSEILIVSDGGTPAAWIAADLLAQAEHDETASAVLVTPDDVFAGEVALEVEKQLKLLPRNAIAVRSLKKFGAIVITENIDQAMEIADRFAPEHLELCLEDPERVLHKVRHAGAVFLGSYTPEAVGDYLGGPNHILPTGGTARFASPLGVYDFVRRMNVLSFSPEALAGYGGAAVRLAEREGLQGHGRSIAVRTEAANHGSGKKRRKKILTKPGR
ncbi:MAG: histidinol dehydrogenase [Syntrophales bacterium]|jgi:histidinol dehydrogenase|nr:histidinol dehydrogenase [Syntrophales bacterium]